MCTAIQKNNLFGRTLDLECSLGESVVLTPRSFPLSFLYEPPLPHHLAMLGCAHLHDGRAFYYDAVNEAGLAVAALNFPHSARYAPPRPSYRNLASFEVIPALLALCRTLSDAKELLREAHVTDDHAAPSLPSTPLHWMIADATGALVAEPTAEGLLLYDNPIGVLANEPPFPYQMNRLCDLLSLSPKPPENKLLPSVPLYPYSRGMGAMGLPGDASSPSRFVRAAFAKEHLHTDPGEEREAFFHLLDTVSQPKGFAVTEKGEPIYTVYSSCMDLTERSYSYTTYTDRSIRTHQMSPTAMTGTTLLCRPMT